MKKKHFIITSGSLFILTLLTFGVACFTQIGDFIKVSGICLGVAGLFFLIVLLVPSKDARVYRRALKSILKDYKDILIKSTTYPNLEGRNVVIVESVDELVKAQEKLRKSIYYKTERRCCSFSILDSTECFIYILKVHHGIVSDVETIRKEIENRERKSKRSYSIFDKIDKSSIIKLENSRVFTITKDEKETIEEVVLEEDSDSDIEVIGDVLPEDTLMDDELVEDIVSDDLVENNEEEIGEEEFLPDIEELDEII